MFMTFMRTGITIYKKHAVENSQSIFLLIFGKLANNLLCEIFPERTSCNARKKKYFIAHYQVQKRDEIYQVSQNCITETFLP